MTLASSFIYLKFSFSYKQAELFPSFIILYKVSVMNLAYLIDQQEHKTNQEVNQQGAQSFNVLLTTVKKTDLVPVVMGSH